MPRRLATLVLLLAVTGCGFHLRGSGGEPLGARLQQLRIEGVDQETGFGRNLARVLRAYGVSVVQATDAAQVVLRVGKPHETQKILSVDRAVRAREYALFSTVRFRLLRPGDHAPPPEQVVRVRRDLVRDPNAVLGSDQEARRLRQEMRQELAQLIVLRLRWE